MNKEVDTKGHSFAEIPISPEIHERFMRTAKCFNLEVWICKGHYRVYFTDPAELYYFGAQMTIPTMGEDFKCGYGLPIQHDHIKDTRKKNK